MKIAILLSGRGSNMRAIVRATRSGQIAGSIALVMSNVKTAHGLAWANREGFETICLPQGDFKGRAEHDHAIQRELEQRAVELVCLAGYMRILSPALIAAFPQRILNVHPSLLPAFPGLEAQKQAWDHGVALSGATVHLVDEQLDHGPILLQEAVPIVPGDDEKTLAARILEAEHRLYPRAVAAMCSGRVRVEGRRVWIR